MSSQHSDRDSTGVELVVMPVDMIVVVSMILVYDLGSKGSHKVPTVSYH